MEARFYEKKEDGAVRCRLCYHTCVIGDKQTGICRVRKNIGGKLESLIFGLPAATNIDPVEKKPLFHFLPGTHTYSLGTLGCNFTCANCQNYDLSQPPAATIEKKIKQLAFMPPEKIVEEALGNGCRSISYTYNEPTVFAEYALDIMKLAREHGLKNIWVSNGYMSDDCLSAILPYLDAVNIDLKSMDDEFYRDNCGAKIGPVLANLKKLKSAQVHLEITTLIIPGLSDDIGMLKKLARFLSDELDIDTPWHISRFSPEISWKLHDRGATGDSVIYEAYNAGKDAGLNYVYVGNMPGDQKENTYCSKCGELAIRRMGYDIDRLDAGGHCVHCDRFLDIVE